MKPIEITLHGNFEARCDEYGLRTVRKRHGVIDVLCRDLLAAGASPDRATNVTRDGTRCFQDRTVGQWAGRRLTEHDVTGFHQQKWKENTQFAKAE